MFEPLLPFNSPPFSSGWMCPCMEYRARLFRPLFILPTQAQKPSFSSFSSSSPSSPLRLCVLQKFCQRERKGEQKIFMLTPPSLLEWHLNFLPGRLFSCFFSAQSLPFFLPMVCVLLFLLQIYYYLLHTAYLHRQAGAKKVFGEETWKGAKFKPVSFIFEKIANCKSFNCHDQIRLLIPTTYLSCLALLQPYQPPTMIFDMRNHTEFKIQSTSHSHFLILKKMPVPSLAIFVWEVARSQ